MKWNKKIEDILTAYKNYIGSNYDKVRLKKFNQLDKNNPEAAASKALVFNWLYGYAQNPVLNDDPSTGGLDFICSPTPHYKYLVEVTCLGNQAFIKNTGCHMRPGQMMTLRLPSDQLFNKVTRKAGQSKRHDLPTVLVITSLSEGSRLILNEDQALDILFSNLAVSVPEHADTDQHVFSTDLKRSIFVEQDKDDPSKIISRRQTISAALLIPVEGAGINIFGGLHPDPIHVFDMNYLANIPFVCIKNWPIENGELHTEWANSTLDDNFFDHSTHIN